MLGKLATIALATTGVAVATEAAAERSAPTARVTYSDLDLSSDTGQATLEWRIDRAVDRLCAVDGNERQIAMRQAQRACERSARASVQTQVVAAVENARARTHMAAAGPNYATDSLPVDRAEASPVSDMESAPVVASALSLPAETPPVAVAALQLPLVETAAAGADYVLASGAMAAPALSTFAFADELLAVPTLPSARVVFSDLDLLSSSGQSALDARIDDAVERVCSGDRNERQIHMRQLQRECMRNAREGAQMQMLEAVERAEARAQYAATKPVQESPQAKPAHAMSARPPRGAPDKAVQAAEAKPQRFAAL